MNTRTRALGVAISIWACACHSASSSPQDANTPSDSGVFTDSGRWDSAVLGTLSIYPDPPSEAGVDRHNDDFSVRVRLLPDGPWQDLYEYKTFVNRTQTRSVYQESSFVAFDFAGAVEIEITSQSAAINSVLIRPQSRDVSHVRNGSVVTFTITEPSQFSFEINGDRYGNLQIFASEMDPGPPPTPTPPGILTLFAADVIHEFPNNRYIAEDNETIYFEPGAIVKGGFQIWDTTGVTIAGRGIADQTHLRKRYSSSTVFEPGYENLHGVSIRRSTDVTIDGLILNDVQHYGFEIIDSDHLAIINTKIFSRVLWGDGIDLVATSDVAIENSYIRTADDCIAIYASRVRTWPWVDKDAANIEVRNTLLYADAAHPIEIGAHGNQIPGAGNSITNLTFENIDILEHDEPLPSFQGAIAINCGDENTCTGFHFSDIRVENFTDGRLLDIQVNPGGAGAATTNGLHAGDITFENLTYEGNGDEVSLIRGINAERTVDGVHFVGFMHNGQWVNKLSDFSFSTNNFANNITFAPSTSP